MSLTNYYKQWIKLASNTSKRFCLEEEYPKIHWLFQCVECSLLKWACGICGGVDCMSNAIKTHPKIIPRNTMAHVPMGFEMKLKKIKHPVILVGWGLNFCLLGRSLLYQNWMGRIQDVRVKTMNYDLHSFHHNFIWIQDISTADFPNKPIKNCPPKVHDGPRRWEPNRCCVRRLHESGWEWHQLLGWHWDHWDMMGTVIPSGELT